jgi:multisubunit Na+/H+ antiporter MnhE subunit
MIKSATRVLLVAVPSAALFYAVWMLLVDTPNAQELIAGAGAVVLATIGSELVRHERIAVASIRPGFLAHAWRPVVRVPADLARLTVAAVLQTTQRRPSRGEFRAVPFRARGSEAERGGRRALAEGAGSFSPNTIVVGVDAERKLILVHELVSTGSDPRTTLDPLELG